MVHAYYFPYWFQAIRGETAFESGLHYIPYAASLFIFAMIAGALVTKTGHYMPPTLLGTAMFAIGSGLMITLQIDTSTARWVGFQIFAGAGIGIASQQAIVAAQAVLPPEAMAIGSSLMIFGQSLAGAIFVSVGNTILRNQLSSSLTEANIPNVDVAAVLAAGATDVRKMIPLEHLHTFLSLYNDAITKVFILVIPLSVLSFLSSLPMEWKSVKAKKPADDKKTPGGEV